MNLLTHQPLKVVVIGGGAAGFFGSIACAEQFAHDVEVQLLEAHQPLAKVKISGGGRCNVTHACFDPLTLTQHYPRGGKALRGAFSRFQPKDTVAWFAHHGVMLKTEPDGRIFPISDSSSTIVDCLMQSARQAGVQVQTRVALAAVQRTEAGFQLQLKSGAILAADRLLLATGSSSIGYQIAASLGHPIEPPVPSLFTFTLADSALRDLAGIAVEPVQAQLKVPNHPPLVQTGALLVTHWGLSGPAILKLSAWGARLLHDQHYRAVLQLNWLPHLTQDQIWQALIATKQQGAKRTVSSQALFDLPRRLWQYLVDRSEIAPEQRWAELSKKAMQSLLQELHQGSYAIQGKGAFKEEFVTCGGVALKEVNFKTMESRLCPGLYFAGEILDIDGVTGGFNFQSAWTTGWLAGQAMGIRM